MVIVSYNDDVFIIFLKEKIVEVKGLVMDVFKVNGFFVFFLSINFIFVDLGKGDVDFF